MFKERNKGWVMIFEDLVKDQRELAEIILHLRLLLFCQFSHEQSPHLFSQLASHTTPHLLRLHQGRRDTNCPNHFLHREMPVSDNYPKSATRGNLLKPKTPPQANGYCSPAVMCLLTHGVAGLLFLERRNVPSRYSVNHLRAIGPL